MSTPTFEALLPSIDARVVDVVMLNWPDTHNTIRATLLAELRQAADRLTSKAPGLRAMVPAGAGQTFRAGYELFLVKHQSPWRQ